MMLARGLRLASIGLAIGVVGAVVSSRLVEGMLFEVAPRDAVVYAGVIAGLGFLSLLATYVPARRAMKTLRRFLKRLSSSVLGKRDDERVREELAEHLEMVTEELVRAGVPREVARRRARIKLGAAVVATEAYRDQQRLRWLENGWQDLR